MSGIKTRGKDKQKRKSRKTSQESPKRNILRNIINAVSAKVKKENSDPWAFDFGPQKERTAISDLPGRRTFKNEVVEIDVRKL